MGENLLIHGELNPRDLCVLGRLSTGMSYSCGPGRAWCLWWGLEGESRTGTTKARWQWGLCLAGVSTVVALSQQLDSVRGTVQLEMVVDDM